MKYALIAIMMMMVAGDVHADSTTPKTPLSMATVRTLSLLPLNSPAMFYARKPISGTVLTITEGLGITLMSFGAYGLAEDCHGDGFCSSVNGLLGRMFLVSGAAFWFPSYLYGVIRAPQAAEEYNASLPQSMSIQPILMATSKGGMVGLGGRF